MAGTFSLCLLGVEGTSKLSGGLFNKSTNPIREGSAFTIYVAPKGPTSLTPPQGALRFCVWIWRDTNIQYFGHLMRRTDSLEKTLMLGTIEGKRGRGWQENEMVVWHHRDDEHQFEQAPRVGSLACCSPWGHKESDKTEWLNWLTSQHRIIKANWK